jgi:hypothetical protein
MDVLIDEKKQNIYFIDYNTNPGFDYDGINELTNTSMEDEFNKMIETFMILMLFHYKNKLNYSLDLKNILKNNLYNKLNEK